MLAASVSILLVCSFLALTLFQIPARAGFLSAHCSTTDIYASGSAFGSNLLSLLQFLYSNATSNGDFAALSVGDVPEMVYGLIMCYADASPHDCLGCLKNATSEAPQKCPGNATAIIYYDQCLLRYSSKEFRSQVADFNDQNCLASPASTLDDESKNLVTNFILDASMDPEQEPQLIAYTLTKTNTKSFSALVQCTRDLSQDGCRLCLRRGYSSGFSSCSHNLTRAGMRLMFGSCYLRYESYYLDITFPPVAVGSTVVAPVVDPASSPLSGPAVDPAVAPASSPLSDPERGKSFGTF